MFILVGEGDGCIMGRYATAYAATEAMHDSNYSCDIEVAGSEHMTEEQYKPYEIELRKARKEYANFM